MAVRDIALLLILIGSVPVILWRPWIGVLMWYWVGLMNPHRLTWDFMHGFPAAMLVGGVTLVALIFVRDRELPPLTKETVLVLLMAAWFTLTSAFAWVPAEAWAYWQQAMKMLGFTLVTTMLIHGRQRSEWLMIVIAGSLAFYGVKGGLFVLTTGGSNRVLGPAQSFIGGNTSLGLAMLMTMPVILVLARQAREGRLACLGRGRWTVVAGWGGYAAFWLAGLATVFTYSRGALLGLAAIAPFVFLKMRYKSVLLVLAFVVASSMMVLVPDKLVERAETIQNYEEDWSAMQRIQAWGVNWNIAAEHPLGAGFRFEYAGDERWLSYANFMGEWNNQARVAHSNYFQMLGQHGFVGLALYLGLLFGVLLRLFRLGWKARSREETRWISEYAWALFVGIIAYAVAGAFLNLAFFTLFYAFVAAAMVLGREHARVLAGSTAETDSSAASITVARQSVRADV